MRWVKFLTVFALLLLGLGVVPTVARADGPDYSDPAVVQRLVNRVLSSGDHASQVWATLTPEARQAIAKYNEVVRFERAMPQTVSVTPLLASGCLSPINGITGYNNFNQPLFSLFLEIDYCYDGVNITSHWGHAWGKTDYPGSIWAYDGLRSDSESGGDQQTYYHYYAQGAFSYCVFGYCTQHSYPWLWLTVYGDGSPAGGDGGFS